MTDVVLAGAGIMSATLAALLREVAPGWQVTVVERLPGAGMESSHAWNNAGTGHAGLCEFNYTPRRSDGTVDVTDAVRIGSQYATSLVFWGRLVAQGRLAPDFVRPVPHMGFGRGADGVAYLRARYEALREHPLFADLEYSATLAEWLPLVSTGRSAEPVAVTRSAQGTDVDFGRPASTAEVAAVLRVCHDAGVAVVPQGGNTGLCGGAVPDNSGTQVVLSLTRMRRIRALDRANQTITVEAGGADAPRQGRHVR